MNQTELKAARHLAMGLGMETLRITTFDDAFYEFIKVFESRGHTQIKDMDKMYSYISGFMPKGSENDRELIDYVRKSAERKFNAKKEYERLQSKDQMESSR
jgi:hypothetical protein